MRSNGVAAGWVPVARETFEYNLVPWFGRRYAPWLRACAREHPVDPRSQVLIPERIYRPLTNGHHIGERVSQRQLLQMGYPRLPSEDELAEARQALRTALMQGAFEAVPALASRVQVLEEQIAETKEVLRHGRVLPGAQPEHEAVRRQGRSACTGACD